MFFVAISSRAWLNWSPSAALSGLPTIENRPVNADCYQQSACRGASPGAIDVSGIDASRTGAYVLCADEGFLRRLLLEFRDCLDGPDFSTQRRILWRYCAQKRGARMPRAPP